MRTLPFLVSAITGVALSQQHGHAVRRSHNHGHLKRAVVYEESSVTVIECVLNGVSISENECNQGIANGTLRWADDGSGAVAIATPEAPSTLINTAVLPPPPPPPQAQPAQRPPPPQVYSPPAAPLPVTSQNRVSGAFYGASAINVNAAFPDGQLPCSEFPENYGAVPLPWLGLQGWASVQQVGRPSARGFGYTANRVNEGCQEGDFCGYYCPSRYLKSQWPATQGSAGESIGGLQCSGGRLRLSNPSQRTLCIAGSNKVRAVIRNRMSRNVAVCRTNYPGDESMTMPLDAQPGQEVEIAVIDQDSYWHTSAGLPTSGQYYINPAGVAVEDACRWGDGSKPIGNWAPLNMGGSWAGNMGYFSLMSNSPTQKNAVLDYKVKITGDKTSFDCEYRNGQICYNGNCASVVNNNGPQGCTVGVREGGTVYYTFTD